MIIIMISSSSSSSIVTISIIYDIHYNYVPEAREAPRRAV